MIFSVDRWIADAYEARAIAATGASHAAADALQAARAERNDLLARRRALQQRGEAPRNVVPVRPGLFSGHVTPQSSREQGQEWLSPGEVARLAILEVEIQRLAAASEDAGANAGYANGQARRVADHMKKAEAT